MQNKEELRQLVAQQIDKLSISAKDTQKYRCMHTSGTTASPLQVLYTQRPDWNPVFLGTGTKTLMLFGSKPLRLDFIKTFFDHKTIHSDICFLNGNAAALRVKYIFKEFQPNSLVGTPTSIFNLIRQLGSQERNIIRSIVLAGELGSSIICRDIKKGFPLAVVTNMYVSTETGILGVSCDSCLFNEYHPVKGVAFSIQEVDDSGVGGILVTKNNKGCLNLSGYTIGDRGLLKSHNGKIVLSILGRSGYDYIKLGGLLLVREELDRVVGNLKKHIVDYKVTVKTVAIKGKQQLYSMQLYVTQTNSSVLSKKELETYLLDIFPRELFVTPNSTLQDAIAEHIFSPITVSVVPKIQYNTPKPQKLSMDTTSL